MADFRSRLREEAMHSYIEHVSRLEPDSLPLVTERFSVLCEGFIVNNLK